MVNEFLKERLRRIWHEAEQLSGKAAELIEELGGEDVTAGSGTKQGRENS